MIFLLLILTKYVNLEVLELNGNLYLSMAILQFLVFLLPSFFFCKLRGQNYTPRLKLMPFGLEKIIFVVFAVFVMILACTTVRLGLYYLGFSPAEYTLYGTGIPTVNVNIYDQVYILIVFALIPAVTEEFLFRGIMYAEYEESGAVSAILLTSVLFAMMHFSLPDFPVYFCGGVLMGLVLYITQSVIASMIVHFVYNLYSLFLESYLFRFISRPENNIFFVFILISLLLLFLTLMFSEAERVLYANGLKAKATPTYAAKSKKYGRMFLTALLSPTFLLCAVVYLLRVLHIF